MSKETSAKIATLAAKYARMTNAKMNEISWQTLYRDLRSLAASALTQREGK